MGAAQRLFKDSGLAPSACHHNLMSDFDRIFGRFDRVGKAVWGLL